MKGFVPTPSHLVDRMVEKLFSNRRPTAAQRLLDPGCGTGAFIEGVVRWCQRNGSAIPNIVGIEADSALLDEARRRVGESERVTLLHQDFLAAQLGEYDFVIGNPPYVAITDLSTEEKTRYRLRYRTASGRFDLYLLFFEQALRHLKRNGRIVFITPEKFLYVQSAAPLRRQLTDNNVEEIELIAESAFGSLVTYPTITTAVRAPYAAHDTRVVLRDGESRTIRLTPNGQSWQPLLNGDHDSGGSTATLIDAFARISCGVATGADDVFVMSESDVPASLTPFAYPTISGRRLSLDNGARTGHSMLVPYSRDGTLLPENSLGALGDYLRTPARYDRLMKRTCVVRKPWYAFHETPPLCDILKPKILCKDISSRPWFVLDERGEIVPRHSVYYLVPRNTNNIHELCDYLNSKRSVDWLMSHCQRAANGFFRLQSHVLKEMPIPEELVERRQLVAV